MERGFEGGFPDWRIDRAAELAWMERPYVTTLSYDDLHDARQEAWLRCRTYLLRPQYARVGWREDGGGKRRDDAGLRRFVRKQLVWAARDVIGSTFREGERLASAPPAQGDQGGEDGADDIGPYGVKKGRSVTATTDDLDPAAVAEMRERVSTVGVWLRGLEPVDRLIFELRRSADPQPGWPEIAGAIEATLGIAMSPTNARQIYQRLQNQTEEGESTSVVFDLLGRRTRADRGKARKAD